MRREELEQVLDLRGVRGELGGWSFDSWLARRQAGLRVELAGRLEQVGIAIGYVSPIAILPLEVADDLLLRELRFVLLAVVVGRARSRGLRTSPVLGRLALCRRPRRRMLGRFAAAAPSSPSSWPPWQPWSPSSLFRS